MTAPATDRVFRDEASGAWVVTGYDEVAGILRGTGWSSDPRRNPLVPEEIRELPDTVLLFMDPPDHGRLRRLVSPAFTPRRIEALRPRVAAIVDAVLDGLGPDTDLISDFAYLVPIAVIAELLDVGAEGAELFLDQTPALVRMLEIDATAADLAESTSASMEIVLALTPLIADRSQRPGDDFISVLLAQPEIEVDEVISTCILLLAAGHETTANLIGNGIQALLDEPEQRAALLADPPRAVNELLRAHGPVKRAVRTALVDQEVGGLAVPGGSTVVLQLDAANQDPRRFKDPLRLDLRRDPESNLAFGAGAHYCLGAALARVEAQEALSALFGRFPELCGVGADPRWRSSETFHGLTELPVSLGRQHPAYSASRS